MPNLDRWESFRGTSPDIQLNRLFGDFFGRAMQEQNQNLTTWAPAVDIYEGENELVVRERSRPPDGWRSAGECHVLSSGCRHRRRGPRR